MAKKQVRKKIKQKLSNFAKDGKISKKELKKIGKISGGSIGTKGLTNLVNKYSKNNQLKINKNFGQDFKKTNVSKTNVGDDNPLGMPDKFTDRIDEGIAGFQTKLDDMFAGQAARDAELERLEQERLRQFELAQRTMLGNEGRSGQQATYRLGGAAGRMKGGTSGFKRRKDSRASRIMSGLSTNSCGT